MQQVWPLKDQKKKKKDNRPRPLLLERWGNFPISSLKNNEKPWVFSLSQTEEGSQIEKDKHYMILFIRGSQKRQQTSEGNKKKQTHRYRDKLVVTVGKGKWGGANRGRGVRGTNYYVNSKYFIIIINRVSHLNHYIVNHYIRHILYINYTSINFF